MAENENKSLVEQYWRAMAARDYATADTFRQSNFVMDWPQSHERINGVETFRAIHDVYPGVPSGEIRDVHGAEDKWTASPLFTLVRVAGSGGFWVAEMELEYPNGDRYMLISLVTLQGGKVAHETQYFAQEIEPPEWRAKWVEHLPSLKEQRQG